MKLISFLGGQEGGADVYTCAGASCETPFVQEAICRLLGTVDDAVLFATEDARKAAWEPVSAALTECGVRQELVVIPNGETEEELWEVFRALETCIDDGEEIVFDITHGYRSLLLVGFLSAAFLQTTGKAEITRLFYGQYRDDENPSLVLDLTPFLSILDWTTSVHAFLESMDAGGINRLANRTAKEAYLSGRPDAPEKLSRFAETLDGFARATRMARPVEALNLAAGIARDIDEVKSEVEVFTPPLVEVLNRIREVGDLGIRRPEKGEGLTWAHIQKELALIGFMVERGLLLQGVTFSREWMVNVMLLARFGDGYPGWLDPDTRYEMSQTLGAALLNLSDAPYNPTYFTDWYLALPCETRATQLWGELSSIRNDFAHCGMREFPPRTTRMGQKAEELYSHLCEFYDTVRG